MANCELTPLGVKCVFGDGRQTFACCVHHLTCAINDALQCLPAVGSLFTDYRCPDFEIEYEEAKEK